MSRPRSRIGALWVIQPEEIRSTPVAAIGGGGLGGDPAGGLGDGAAVDHRDRAAQGLGVHVVEQHRIDAGVERLVELVERVDLELDLDQVAGMRRARSSAGAHAAGQRDVVVLDQHRVVEPEAVIGAAAEPHRVLFEGAQSRRGLAGADDPRLVAGDRVDQRARRGGDAGHAAEQVERGALGGQHRRAPGR